MPTEGLLLGLSTGTYCTLTCAPILLPFLFAERRGVGANARLVGQFLLGRLVAYVLVGALLGIMGAYAMRYVDPNLQRILSGGAYLVLGIVLFVHGLYKTGKRNLACRVSARLGGMGNVILLGFGSGFAICPPFVAAAARVFGMTPSGSEPLLALGGGILYFFLFFIGTAVFFIPLLAVPFLKRHRARIALVARGIMLLLGVYFAIFLGVFRLVGV